tara:strand:- start:1582 stop:2310 length:729 start_codon:yes stop_codon:yes gene_type:complete
MNHTNYELNITLRCNLRCPNCNRLCNLYPDRTATAEDMTTAQIEKSIGQLRDSTTTKAKRIKIVGGEPTLHPRLPSILKILAAAIDEGLIQKVKIDSNKTLPRPATIEHPAIRWSGRKPSRKKHLPFLWSPADMGFKTIGPCRMPFICGPSLDKYGWLPCSSAIAIVRVFGMPGIYRDALPSGPWAMKELCRHCIWSMDDMWCNDNVIPLSETKLRHLTPTESWAKALMDYRGGIPEGLEVW